MTTSDASNYWHPLAWVSHMLDVTVYGLDPRGHHTTSILIHAANAALLFLVLAAAPMKIAREGRAVIVALLFALHPLHVESVAWIAERKDVLCAFFWILGIGAYVWYSRRRGPARYAAVVVCFVLALLSKPMAVTFPFTLLLLDFWPLATEPGAERGTGFWKHRLIEKVPLVLLAIGAAAWNFSVHPAGAIASLDQISLPVRLANAIVSYGGYIVQGLWPRDLAILYPHAGMPSPLRLVAAFTLLAVISVVAVSRRKLQPYLLFGWCWYLGTLVPVIGLVQVGGQAHADRYTYLPFVGLFVAAVWATGDLLEARAPRWAGAVLATVAIGACAVLSWHQLGYWRSSETLFRRTLEVTGSNWLIHYNLARVLANAGNLEGALEQDLAAIANNPGSGEARVNYGNDLMKSQRRREAIASYREAIRLDPTLVLAYENLARALAIDGDAAGAIALCARSRALAPDDPRARLESGRTLTIAGRYPEATRDIEAAIALDPGRVEARSALAIALTKLGDRGGARAAYRGALERAPDDTEALNGLAWLLATSPDASDRDGPDAVRLAEQAVAQTQGQNASALDTLAAAYAEAGRFDEAIATIDKALMMLTPPLGSEEAEDFRNRRRLYAERRPFRDAP